MGVEIKEEDLKKAVELASQLEKAAEEVKKNGEKLQAEMKNLGQATAETKTAVDKALAEHNKLAQEHADLVKKHGDLGARIVEIEQTIAKRRGEGGTPSGKSMGELFIESKQFKEFNGKGAVRVQMSRKDILNVPASQVLPDALVPPDRVPGIVTPPQRKLVIRDLLAPGQTTSGLVEYVQETGFTNSAAVVTEGTTKPQSELTFELKPAPVRTIATIFKASRQILDDAPALQSYIDARARYGLSLTEENELLNGDGTGAHLKGLIPSATPFNAAFVPSAQTRIDTIRLAILQVFQANFPASGVVLNPVDWAAIQLTKDSQNRYIIGNPQDGNPAQLWNLPVAESLSMTATEALVGAFDIAAQIFDRLEVEVLLSTENSTDFEKNMITIRAEERLALAIYRPEAFVHIDFDVAT